MTDSVSSAASTEVPLDWRYGLLTANVWLLFLSFPLLSLLLGDHTTAVKAAVSALIVLFAAIHVLGYRAAARLNQCSRDDLNRLPLLDLRNPQLYFVGLVTVQAITVLIAGNGLLGLMPFIVVFALFNFSWATAGAVLVFSVATVLILPALAGQLNDLWFFSIIVISVGAGASFSRMAEESMGDRARLQASLAVSDERNRVARDVHDVLGHSLTAVILKTQVCAKLLDSLQLSAAADQDSIDKVRAELGELDSVARRAMAEVRSTVGGLRVAALSDEISAARAVLADASVELTVQGNSDSVPDDFEATVAWVVRESITNIVRHARATTCTIEIGGSGDQRGTLIGITDDGVGLGFDADRPAGNHGRRSGNGLRGMRERVATAGGELIVGPGRNGRGTTVLVRA